MLKKKTQLALAVAAAVGLTAPAAQATTGYFSHGYGAVQGGMGGAGVALPQDAMIGAINPAGMVMTGTHGVIGAAAFSPLRKYTVSGAARVPTPTAFPPFAGGPVESDNKIFLIPNFAYNWMLNDDSSVGVTVFGNGGMNTEYMDADTPFGIGTFGGGGAGDPNAGVDYAQLFINTTYARKIGAKGAVGISAIVNYSRFKADGLAGFGGFSTAPTKLSNNGYDTDWGFGVKVGVLGEVAPGFTVGASAQTKIKNKMDKYAGLFAKGGQFDIPATATVGIAYAVSKSTKIAVDVQKIWYNDVDAIGNASGKLLTCFGGVVSDCLGGATGAGFGWNNMTVIKVGLQHEAGNGWTWRAGFATGDQPIDPSEVTLNILAPGVMEEHFTLGIGKKLGNGREFNAAFMYAPSVSVTGPSLFVAGDTIKLEMKQYQFQAELKF